MLVAVLGLVLPVVLGVTAGAARLFAEPDAAIAHLKRFALYFAFPALIFVVLADATFQVPRGAAFWLVVPVSLGLALAAVAALPRQRGTVALVTVFGNTAYLGLPVCEAVLGRPSLGLAALVSSLHILVSLLVGPWLLLRWEGARGSTSPLRKVLRQPLLWAPLVGLAARALPAGLESALVAAVSPLGRAAGPVALFLLGLYVFVHRGRPGDLRAAGAHVAMRLGVVPALTGALVVGALRLDLLGTDEARVLLLQAGMPAAITTFALAQEFGVSRERVAQAIVASTLLAAVTLPVLALLALAVGSGG